MLTILLLLFSFFLCNLITPLVKVLSCLDQPCSYLQDMKYCKLYISLNKYIVVVILHPETGISTSIQKRYKIHSPKRVRSKRLTINRSHATKYSRKIYQIKSKIIFKKFCLQLAINFHSKQAICELPPKPLFQSEANVFFLFFADKTLCTQPRF